MELYLTTRQVADILGYRRTSSVLALIECGKLECERVTTGSDGRRLYHPTVAELASYLRAHDQALLPAVLERWPDVPRELSA